MAFVAAAIAIVGAVASLSSDRKAAKQRRKANKLEKRRRAIANVVARRKAAAAVRRNSASVEATSVAQGTQGGSGALASSASFATQTFSEIGKQRQLESIDTARDAEIRRANLAQRQGQTVGQVAGIANSFASASNRQASTQKAEVPTISHTDLESKNN